MNNQHPWQLKKIKFWGLFWSYELNSTANSVYSPQKCAKWAELAMLFSWQLQNGPQDLDFSPRVPIIHLSLYLLSIECPNLLDIIKFSQAVRYLVYLNV